ncbi:MAG: hypothetical protein ACRCW6_03475, partial [Mycoplasmoidaceae bacterium]
MSTNAKLFKENYNKELSGTKIQSKAGKSFSYSQLSPQLQATLKSNSIAGTDLASFRMNFYKTADGKGLALLPTYIELFQKIVNMNILNVLLGKVKILNVVNNQVWFKIETLPNYQIQNLSDITTIAERVSNTPEQDAKQITIDGPFSLTTEQYNWEIDFATATPNQYYLIAQNLFNITFSLIRFSILVMFKAIIGANQSNNIADMQAIFAITDKNQQAETLFDKIYDETTKLQKLWNLTTFGLNDLYIYMDTAIMKILERRVENKTIASPSDIFGPVSIPEINGVQIIKYPRLMDDFGVAYYITNPTNIVSMKIGPITGIIPSDIVLGSSVNCFQWYESAYVMDTARIITTRYNLFLPTAGMTITPGTNTTIQISDISLQTELDAAVINPERTFKLQLLQISTNKVLQEIMIRPVDANGNDVGYSENGKYEKTDQQLEIKYTIGTKTISSLPLITIQGQNIPSSDLKLFFTNTNKSQQKSGRKVKFIDIIFQEIKPKSSFSSENQESKKPESKK